MSRMPSGLRLSRRAVLMSGLLVLADAARGGDAAGAVPAGVQASSRAVHPHPWRKPVYWLNDYLHRYPHARFPRRPIMLTIDDGPSPEWTPKYLRLLARHRVTATFCMIGRQVPANRALVRAVADHGHVIANHTWSHDEALETRPDARLRSEIERASVAIHRATGIVPNQFRAPGGVWGPRVLRELGRQEMLPLGWDVDPRDWQLPGTGAIESAMLAAGPHDVILCHDGGGDRSQTYAALKTVIPTLLDRGYHFVTLPAPHVPHRGR